MARITQLLSSYPSRKNQNLPRYVIFHTNGGSTTSSPSNLINYIESQLRAGNTSVTQPHHIVGMSGDDYVTLFDDAKGVASFRAEGMCLSVETQDSGYNNVPLNNDPWTPNQFEALAQIAANAYKTHGVPLRFPTHPLNDGGIGWHAMWGFNTYSTSPGTYGNITVGGRSIALNNPWTTVVGKVCPGNARINQMPALVNRAKEIVGMSPVESGEDMIYLVKEVSSPEVFATNYQTKVLLDGPTFNHLAAVAKVSPGIDDGPTGGPGFSTIPDGTLRLFPQVKDLISLPPGNVAITPDDVARIASATRSKFTEVPLK